VADKGEYRAIYASLLDDPDFQELSSCARLCFFALKLKLGQSGIDLFYAETLPRLTGYPFDRVSEGVSELQSAGWLVVEKSVFWIRNGLRYDPTHPLANSLRKKGISNYLQTLPKVALVNEFARYYDLPEPFVFQTGHGSPIEGASKPTRTTETETETEKETTSSSLRSSAPKSGAGKSPNPDPDVGNSVAIAPDLHPDPNQQPGRVTGGEILAAWIDQQPARPSNRDAGKFGAACKRLAEEHPAAEIAAAMVGMGQLYPHSDGQPWDPFDLERKFAKALAASQQHPDVQDARAGAEFDRILNEREMVR
jgi:hypothetical protein